MKIINQALLLVFWSIIITSCIGQNIEDKSDFSILKGPYLGQKLPGLNAEVFAPGIICKENHETVCGFFNNGSIFIYRSIPTDFDNAINSPIPIFITELKNNTWTKPIYTKYPGEPWFHNLNFVTQNETFVYAEWIRDDKGKRIDLDIFKEYKTKSGWSKPERLNYPINSDKFDSWPSLSNKGNLYFFSGRDGGFGKTDIYRSEIINGDYKSVENLGEFVNSEDHDHDPFIDPDENYLIFNSSREGGFGKDDLYISFMTTGEAWSNAINMGKGINSKYDDNRPYITPDGKYLFFTRFINGNSDIYWVSLKIIEELKPSELLKKE